MAAWSEIKRWIIDGFLLPPSGEGAATSPYTDEAMLVWARFACTEISQHYAQETVLDLPAYGFSEFRVPDDAILPPSKSGLVIYRNGTKEEVLKPVSPVPGGTVLSGPQEKTFWEWPAGRLRIFFVPEVDSRIQFRYYKVWSPPIGDKSILEFPVWLEQPFCYLVAAYALGPASTQSASIRQYNRKQDAGSPEDNPLNKQARYFVEQAYRLLAKVPPQDKIGLGDTINTRSLVNRR